MNTENEPSSEQRQQAAMHAVDILDIVAHEFSITYECDIEELINNSSTDDMHRAIYYYLAIKFTICDSEATCYYLNIPGTSKKTPFQSLAEYVSIVENQIYKDLRFKNEISAIETRIDARIAEYLETGEHRALYVPKSKTPFFLRGTEIDELYSIIQIVSFIYDIPTTEIFTKDSKKSDFVTAHAKRLICYLALECSTGSLCALSYALGYSNHSGISKAVSRLKSEMGINEALDEEVKQIKQLFLKILNVKQQSSYLQTYAPARPAYQTVGYGIPLFAAMSMKINLVTDGNIKID